MKSLRRVGWVGLLWLALGLSGCAWGSVGLAAVLGALLLALGAGCSQRSLGSGDDAAVIADGGVDSSTPACGPGRCVEHMTCVDRGGQDWCVPDVDGDGVPDETDNCIWLHNPDQIDSDGDGVGDRCDLFPQEDNRLSPCGPWCMVDEDGDGIDGSIAADWPWPQGTDNCPLIYNPGQEDADGDGVGDACDLCPGPNPITPCGDACLDSDGDGLSDWGDCTGAPDDPCWGTPSVNSADYDGDGLPDVCDPEGAPPLAERARRRAVLEGLARGGVLDPAVLAAARANLA